MARRIIEIVEIIFTIIRLAAYRIFVLPELASANSLEIKARIAVCTRICLIVEAD
jgi:hypothetical protein